MAKKLYEEQNIYDIACAIREKRGCSDTYKTCDMANAIRTIPTGDGSSIIQPLNPVEVYNTTRPADWLPMPTPNTNEIYLLFNIADGCSTYVAFTATCSSGNYTVELGTVSNGVFVSTNSTIVASDSTYETELFADDYDNLTSDGKKQAMIKISGTNLLTWDAASHSKPLVTSLNIVEIACNLPEGTMVDCGGLYQLKYFAWYGSNRAVDLTGMFSGCNSLLAVLQLDTSNVTNMYRMFNDCNSLTTIPQLNTSNVTNMESMFFECRSLTTIPLLDTSIVTNMYQMFRHCGSLTTIPLLDTSNVTTMTYMFADCNSLTTIPQLNTSNVTSMKNMFSDCDSLTTIPQLDTSNVTDMYQMFFQCFALTTIPQLDTSKVTTTSSMFSYCQSLATIPLLDMSNNNDSQLMFGNCHSLLAIPLKNMSKKTWIKTTMFYYCYSLTSIPVITLGPRNKNMFKGCYSLKNVLFDPTVAIESDEDGLCSFSLSDCPLEHTALVAMLNSLPITTPAVTITISECPGTTELTPEEIAIATAKGWTIAT